MMNNLKKKEEWATEKREVSIFIRIRFPLTIPVIERLNRGKP
jgi:hypothetical protein